MLLARNVTAEGRSRAFVGGASVPVSQLAEVAEPLVAVHGQSDQHRLLQPRAQRDALDSYGGDDGRARCSPTYRALHAELLEAERELAEVVAHARERAREADLLRFGLAEIEAVSPAGGRGRLAGRRGAPARPRRHPAHGGRVRAGGAVVRRGQPRRPGRGGCGAHPARRRPRPRPGGRRAGRPGRRDHLPALRRRGRRRLLRRRARDRPGPAGRRLRAPGGADGADPQVRRDRGRGAGLGRVVGRPAGRARRHRRPDRRGSASAATTCATGWVRRRGALSAARAAAAARLSTELTGELDVLAMPHAVLDVAGPADPEPTTGLVVGRRGGCGSARRASTRSSCCWPPTPAASRARCTRAPRAVSCPG